MTTPRHKYKIVYRRKVGNGSGFYKNRTEYYDDLFLLNRKINHLSGKYQAYEFDNQKWVPVEPRQE